MAHDINLTDRYGFTQLHIAVQENNIIVTQGLIEAGANLNAVDRRGNNTPLHYAVMHNNIELSQKLIAAGANLNIVNNHGDTPLHNAVTNNNRKISKDLIVKGANVDAKNEIGKKPSDKEFIRNIKHDFDAGERLKKILKGDPNNENIDSLNIVVKHHYKIDPDNAENIKVASDTDKILDTASKTDDDKSIDDLQREIDQATIAVNSEARTPSNDNTTDMNAMSKAQPPEGAKDNKRPKNNSSDSSSEKKPAAKRTKKSHRKQK